MKQEYEALYEKADASYFRGGPKPTEAELEAFWAHFHKCDQPKPNLDSAVRALWPAGMRVRTIGTPGITRSFVPIAGTIRVAVAGKRKR